MAWFGDRDKHAQAARRGWQHRKHGAQVRKFGGSASHTKKYLTKQTPRKKAARKAAPAAKPQEGYKLIATQKQNGKWIVSRVYANGRVVQEPQEWTVNPLGKKEKKHKPQRGQSELFGGDYERSRTYGAGLFDQ